MNQDDNSQPKTALSSKDSARLSAILETAVEAIITINERGTIESFNKTAERMFGYFEAEVVGQNVSLLMPQPLPIAGKIQHCTRRVWT